MRAIVVTEFGKPEVLKLVEKEIPKISPTQVLIRVEKTSVNYADIKARYGQKDQKSSPFVPGLDAAGVVVDVGSEINHLQIGQRVIAFPYGSYAEYVAAEGVLTYAIPDEIDYDLAAACPTVSFLSYKMLTDIARIEKGETILIHSAAGGVGTTAIQMAKLLGAGKIIGTVGNAKKASVAQMAGADYTICYETEDFAEKVNEITDGKGVNIVLDSIAGSVTEKSFSCLARYGRLVQFGNSSGVAGNIKTSNLHSSCRSVLGYSLGTTRKHRPETLLETGQAVIRYLKEGKLKFNIAHRFSLEEAISAHELIESRASTGKILLEVNC